MGAENILVLAHTDASGVLGKGALEVIAVATALDGAVSVGVVGKNAKDACDQLGSCGAKRFLAVQGSDVAEARYASDALAFETIARAVKPSVIIAAGTSRISRVLSGVAHRLGGKIDTHVSEIVANGGALAVRRWYYRQRMEGQIQRTARPWVIVIDPGSAKPWSGSPAGVTPDVLTLDLPSGGKRTSFVACQSPHRGEQTIRPDAELLFVAGAGWTKKQADGQAHPTEARELILDFLRKSTASLGGSKSIVDMDDDTKKIFDFMTHLNQVGQTGATPRHPKGLSACCHGEEPHVVGWRFVNERRAINTDANCGWAHGKADVLYVADAFKVMAKVNELLGRIA